MSFGYLTGRFFPRTIIGANIIIIIRLTRVYTLDTDTKHFFRREDNLLRYVTPTSETHNYLRLMELRSIKPMQWENAIWLNAD